MRLPYIFMTYGCSISIRFPQVDNGNVNIVYGEDKGKLPSTAYSKGSPAEIALSWAETFKATWTVSERENGGYNVVIKFSRMNDALEFKNNFYSRVYGAA